MRLDITPGRGRISVGPPGGPTETIPASVTVTITDADSPRSSVGGMSSVGHNVNFVFVTFDSLPPRD